MKIRVIVDKYEHQGLYKGSEHEGTYDPETHVYSFMNYGKLWALDALDVVELKSPLDIQYGGDHYKDKGIQPIEYITANNLDFCQGNIVKYVTRHKDKNGAEDIRKVIHYAQFILKFEYGEDI